MKRLVGPAVLTLLIVLFYWKLTLTTEYVWFDHPDMCYLEIPRLQFQAREMHNGRFPLWDPSLWLGQSLLGQTQPGPIFPLTVAFLLLPLKNGYIQNAFLNYYWVVLHLLAALACYALCREWERSRRASILAAIGFGCGGFLASVAWLDVMAGGIFTPLVLLYLSRTARGIRPWASAAVSGLFLGLAWLTGHHEIPLLVSLATIAVWFVLAMKDRSKAAPAAVSLLICGLIAAAQLLPTVEFGLLAKRWVGVADPVGWHDAIPYTIATIYSLPARGLLQTFLPSADRYADCAPFLGLSIVAMALFGIAAAWSDNRVRWLALGTALATLFALGAATPLHGALYQLLPGLGKARMPVRAIHLSGFGLCVLAAYGLDEMLARRHPLTTRFAMRTLTGLGLVILAWSIGNRDLDDRLLLSGFLALALAAALADRFTRNAQTAIWLTVALAELHGVTTSTFHSRFREGGLQYAGEFERDRDIADFLRAAERQSPVRVQLNEEQIHINYGDYHGVDALQGYVAGVPNNVLRAELHTARSHQLFGVSHYLSKTPQTADQVSLYEGTAGIKVFQNQNVMPRAWSVHEIITASKEQELRTLVQEKPIDFHRTAVLLGPAPAVEACAGDDVSVLARAPNRVRVQANLNCTGMVILSDSYYPGWHATVDGKPATIHEAYGAIRGVVVERGQHQVEFRFRPRSVYIGAGLLLLGLFATAVLIIRRR